MEILIVLGGLFSFVTILFIAIAVFYPEWVGITGNVAKTIEAEHRDGTSATELGDGIAGFPRKLEDIQREAAAKNSKKTDPS